MCGFLVAVVYSLMHVYRNSFVKIKFDECFSEVIESSIKIHEKNTILISISKNRSRHAKSVSLYYFSHLEFNLLAISRDSDCEPNKLLVKQLAHSFNNSRSTTKALRKKNSIAPGSLQVHFIYKCSLGQELLLDEDHKCLCQQRKYIRVIKNVTLNNRMQMYNEGNNWAPNSSHSYNRLPLFHLET